MPYKITYLDEANLDVKEAKAWYKQQRKGLEKQFAKAIIKAVSHIQDNPYAYAIRYNDIRIIHPKKFPYGIHFYIDNAGKEIVITAIIHEYRDMEIVQNR